MEQLKEQQLFTVEEAAKWCNISRNAMYQHYRRGHINCVPMRCHRLFFTRAEIDQFRSLYCPFNGQ